MAVEEPVTFIPDEELPQNDPHHRSRYHNFAMALRGNLGMWAVYPTKVAVPSSAASRINNDAYGALPCTDFEAKVVQGVLYVRYWPEEMREDQTRRRRRETTAPPRKTTTNSDWAIRLLERVGPQRAEVLYKMLSRVLHPDMPLGDTELMQELNEARSRLS